jgi:hypothetical protein
MSYFIYSGFKVSYKKNKYVGPSEYLMPEEWFLSTNEVNINARTPSHYARKQSFGLK